MSMSSVPVRDYCTVDIVDTTGYYCRVRGNSVPRRSDVPNFGTSDRPDEASGPSAVRPEHGFVGGSLGNCRRAMGEPRSHRGRDVTPVGSSGVVRVLASRILNKYNNTVYELRFKTEADQSTQAQISISI